MVEKKNNIETGIIVAAALAIISVCTGRSLNAAIIVVSVITLLIPIIFTPLTWLLLKLGYILGNILSQLILFVTFYLVVSPIGFCHRVLGSDSMKIRQFKKDTGSVFLKENRKFDKRSLEKQY